MIDFLQLDNIRVRRSEIDTDKRLPWIHKCYENMILDSLQNIVINRYPVNEDIRHGVRLYNEALEIRKKEAHSHLVLGDSVFEKLKKSHKILRDHGLNAMQLG